MKRLRAIQALRWNYTWRGVWTFLKGRNRRYGGRRGIVVVARFPQRVIDDQRGIAEGVFS